MTRAILVALGTGTIITSAAAIGIGAARDASPTVFVRPQSGAELARIVQAARERQRALIEAHAARGRALLESHDPYTVRPG